jgi:hypothetical protein
MYTGFTPTFSHHAVAYNLPLLPVHPHFLFADKHRQYSSQIRQYWLESLRDEHILDSPAKEGDRVSRHHLDSTVSAIPPFISSATKGYESKTRARHDQGGQVKSQWREKVP